MHQARKDKISEVAQEYQRINQELFFNLQQLELLSEDPLKLYSQLNYYYAGYLHQTKQSCYFVLNSDKQVLFMCMQNDSKFSAISKKINSDEMGKGEFVTQYNDKQSAKVKYGEEK